MLFHRTRGTVIVQSRDEEEELGGEWSRTILPPDSLTAAAGPSPYDPPAPPKRSHKKKVDPCPPPQT